MLIVYTQSQVCWMLLITLRARFAGCWLITYRARSSQSWMLLVEFPQTEVSNVPTNRLEVDSRCNFLQTHRARLSQSWMLLLKTLRARLNQSWMLLGEFPRAEASNFHEPKPQEATRVLLQEGCSFLQWDRLVRISTSRGLSSATGTQVRTQMHHVTNKTWAT